MTKHDIVKSTRILLWIPFILLVTRIWRSMSHLVYPGVLSMVLPGGFMIPSGYFIGLYCFACLCIPIIITLMPKHWRISTQIIVIFVLAILGRFLFVPMAVSSDLNRTMWEGNLLIHGVNPYEHPPVKPGGLDLTPDAADPFRTTDDPFYTDIVPVKTSPLYPPLILALAGFAGHISASFSAWRIMVITVDLCVLGLIIIELKQRRLPVRYALIYAVHPLVLTSFAGQGRPEVFLIALVMVSLLAYRRHAYGWMFLCLGLAMQVKYYPVLLLPMLVNRHNWKKFWITPFIAVVPWIPFCTRNCHHIIDRFITYGHSISFNSAIHGLLHYLTGRIQYATVFSELLFLLIWLFILRHLHPARTGSSPLDIMTLTTIILSAYFLFLPSVQPWYLTVLVMLICIRPFFSVVVLSMTISAAYTVDGYLHMTGQWHYPFTARLIVWVPFILFLAFDLRRIVFRHRQELRRTYGQRISVIIPTYNDQKSIRECIASAEDKVFEIIVVDGGSTDATIDMVEESCAQLVIHDQPLTRGGGRGGQIHAGLIEACGDIAVVVHPDTLLVPGQLRTIQEIMALNPEIAGGAMGSEFDVLSVKNELITTANDCRAGFLGLSFGDQVQFFRREWVLASGMFPDIPLMEDVELSIRLKRLGSTVYCWGQAITSSKRWHRKGFNRAMLVIRLTTAWLIHRMLGTPDPVAFFKTYYKK